MGTDKMPPKHLLSLATGPGKGSLAHRKLSDSSFSSPASNDTTTVAPPPLERHTGILSIHPHRAVRRHSSPSGGMSKEAKQGPGHSFLALVTSTYSQVCVEAMQGLDVLPGPSVMQHPLPSALGIREA